MNKVKVMTKILRDSPKRWNITRSIMKKDPDRLEEYEEDFLKEKDSLLFDISLQLFSFRCAFCDGVFRLSEDNGYFFYETSNYCTNNFKSNYDTLSLSGFSTCTECGEVYKYRHGVSGKVKSISSLLFQNK